jgi:hypothetical protein
MTPYSTAPRRVAASPGAAGALRAGYSTGTAINFDGGMSASV